MAPKMVSGWCGRNSPSELRLVTDQVLVSGAAKDGGSGSRGVAVGSSHPPLGRGPSNHRTSVASSSKLTGSASSRHAPSPIFAAAIGIGLVAQLGLMLPHPVPLPSQRRCQVPSQSSASAAGDWVQVLVLPFHQLPAGLVLLETNHRVMRSDTHVHARLPEEGSRPEAIVGFIAKNFHSCNTASSSRITYKFLTRLSGMGQLLFVRGLNLTRAHRHSTFGFAFAPARHSSPISRDC